LFYGSTHEKDNFPGTGREPKLVDGVAEDELFRRIVNRYLHAGADSRRQFYEKWSQILGEMVRFGPDLVILSAGFDAHDDDPLASCELLEEDFYWATMEVLKACHTVNEANPPPCISVLEGGYDLDALASSAAAHVAALFEGYVPAPRPPDPIKEVKREKHSAEDAAEVSELTGRFDQVTIDEREPRATTEEVVGKVQESEVEAVEVTEDGAKSNAIVTEYDCEGTIAHEPLEPSAKLKSDIDAPNVPEVEAHNAITT